MHQPFTSGQPLVYQAMPARRKLGIFFGSVLALAGLACVLLMLFDWDALGETGASLVILIFLVGLTSGVPLAATSLRYKLSLMPQSLVLRSAWKTETLLRSDIAGYRTMAEYGGNILFFISQRGPAHGVAVKLSFKTDDAFLAWMDGIPDLNSADFNASAQEVEARLRADGFSGDAIDAIATGSRRMIWLLYSSIAACLWALMAPEPRWLVIAINAILPLLSLELYRRQPELFNLWELKMNSAKTDLGMNLLIPGTALALIAWGDRATMPWIWCAPGTVALAIALSALFGTWRKGRKNFVTGAALMLPYACALLLLAFGNR